MASEPAASTKSFTIHSPDGPVQFDEFDGPFPNPEWHPTPSPLPCSSTPWPLSPSVSGIQFNDERYAAQLALTGPVASILQLEWRPGVNIDDRGTPNAKIWQRSLEYISTIPGFVALRWGNALQNPASTILMIQWIDGSGWRAFQNSIGIGPSVYLLDSPPTNRAVKLDLELDRHASNNETIDFISFRLDPDLFQAEACKTSFLRAWQAKADGLLRADDLRMWGTWLEADETSSSLEYRLRYEKTFRLDPKPLEREPLMFITLVSSKGRKHVGPGSHDSALALFEPLAIENVCEIAWATFEIRDNHISANDSIRSLMDAPINRLPRDGINLLFQTPLTCRYSDFDASRLGANEFAPESLAKAPPNARLYPRPNATLHKMGNVNQHSNLPVHGLYRAAALPTDLHHLCLPRGALQHQQLANDGFTKTLESTMLTVFHMPQCFLVRTVILLDEQPGHESGPRNYEPYDTIIVFVIWRPDTTLSSELERRQLLQALDKYLAASRLVQHTLIKKRSPILDPDRPRDPQSEARSANLWWTKSDGILEITTFTPTMTGMDLTAFSHAYSRYIATTGGQLWPPVNGFHRLPCTPIGACWLPLRSKTDQGIFLGLATWPDTAARNRWFQDFAQGMQTSYEYFGALVDALKILTDNRAVSRLFSIQPVHEEMKRVLGPATIHMFG